MKPGSRVRINIPSHPLHGHTGTVVKQDLLQDWDEGQIVWIVRLDIPEPIKHMGPFRPVGIDQRELEEI